MKYSPSDPDLSLISGPEDYVRIREVIDALLAVRPPLHSPGYERLERLGALVSDYEQAVLRSGGSLPGTTGEADADVRPLGEGRVLFLLK